MAAVTEDEVKQALRRVLDPEIGLNIVDLGLVYDIEIDGEGDVRIEMTLTTPGCPMHDAIDQSVQRVLETVEGVRDVAVDLVWAPPWTPEMITEEGQKALGWI